MWSLPSWYNLQVRARPMRPEIGPKRSKIESPARLSQVEIEVPGIPDPCRPSLRKGNRWVWASLNYSRLTDVRNSNADQK
jgi:hypothetical protein